MFKSLSMSQDKNMNRKKWTRPEKMLWLVPGLFLASIGAVIYAPRFSRSFEAMFEQMGIPTREAPRRVSCQSNLKQMGLGIMQYVRDWDEKFPLVATGGQSYGWADALQPYVRSTALYHCPKNSGSASPYTIIKPTSRDYTDYFLNARLSRQSLSALNNAPQTILFGEGTTSDARSAKSALPAQWVSNPDSPARLHFAKGSASRSGANYAFADGHVKWIEPQNIGTGPTLVNSNISRFAATAGAATFSLR